LIFRRDLSATRTIRRGDTKIMVAATFRPEGEAVLVRVIASM